MAKTQTKSTTNNGVCEKIYKAISFSPVFRTIRRISLSPTTAAAAVPNFVEIPITSGNPIPPTNPPHSQNFRQQLKGIDSFGKQNRKSELAATEIGGGIKPGRKINGVGEVEERKEAMGKRVDSLNDRVSNYINRAKLKMRTSSNVDGDN